MNFGALKALRIGHAENSPGRGLKGFIVDIQKNQYGGISSGWFLGRHLGNPGCQTVCVVYEQNPGMFFWGSFWGRI